MSKVPPTTRGRGRLRRLGSAMLLVGAGMGLLGLAVPAAASADATVLTASTAARAATSVGLTAGSNNTFTAKVSGAGAYATVTATFTQATLVRKVTLGTTDARGAFSGSFSVDKQIQAGRYKVAVTASGRASRTLTGELRTSPSAGIRLYQKYTGSNGKQLEYHHFKNGGRGVLFYFDGDETWDYHHPLVSSSVTYTNGFNGLVQRLNEEAKKRGVDLVFVEHPNATQTWWEDVKDTDRAEVTVKEMVRDLGGANVLLAGYSGGSEFLVGWMLSGGNGWGPQNTALVMIGGGTLEGPLAAPTRGRENQAIDWVVGADDGVGATFPAEWSAIGAATDAQRKFKAKGYTGARLEVIPNTNHLQYDFRAIIGGRLDALMSRAR